MTEKNMQTLFGKYLQAYPPDRSEVYELKIAKGKSLPFSALAPHQREYLVASEREGFYHKITDQPIFSGQQTRYHSPKPFDCFYLCHTPAYVVIWFYKPRQAKIFIKIPIFAFLTIEGQADRKSITEEMALAIGEPINITKLL